MINLVVLNDNNYSDDFLAELRKYTNVKLLQAQSIAEIDRLMLTETSCLLLQSQQYKELLLDRKLLEEKNTYLAFHDPLTGLYNIRSMYEQVNNQINKAQLAAQEFAVLFIDLDRFKLINDSLGHNIGDLLLQEIADKLSSRLQEVPLFRPGGDEFVGIVKDMSQIDTVIAGVFKVFSEPFQIIDRDLIITASIGIAVYPEHGLDGNTLCRNADAAMYEAKDKGKNQHCYYSEDLGWRMQEYLDIENSMRNALENNEFYLEYQPQVDTSNNNITGVEALLRWEHPERGLIMPKTFIHLAEETGLIIPIGEWVLREACKQNKKWQDDGCPAVVMSVNVSPVQFMKRDFVDKVKQVLEETGLKSKYLELEITESTAMHNVEDAVAKINNLRDIGVSVSIDDFGTGYSSLNHFGSLPVTKLKIDRTFINRVLADSKNAAIVDTLILMAQKLGIDIVAEGVETELHKNYLTQRDCHVVQGYLYSKPLKAVDCERYIRERKDDQCVG